MIFGSAKNVKTAVAGMAFAAFVLSLAISGCENAVMPPKVVQLQKPGRTLKIGLTLANEGTNERGERTLMPVFNVDDFESYRVSWDPMPGNQNKGDYKIVTPDEVEGNGVLFTVEGIDVGDWEFTVYANRGGVPAAEGSTTITVTEENNPLKIEVAMHFIFDDGTGDFFWSVNNPLYDAILTGEATIDIRKISDDSLYRTITITPPAKQPPYVIGPTKEPLPAGQYRVVGQVELENDKSDTVSYVLHVYSNMETTWEWKIAPTTALMDEVLYSWNGSGWKFPSGLTLDHFALLENGGEFAGIVAGNYRDADEVASVFTALSPANNPSKPPYKIDMFRQLVDAALIVKANGDGRIPKLDAHYLGTQYVEDLITGIVNEDGNDSALAFDWKGRNDATGEMTGPLPVTVGGLYKVDVDIGMAFVQVDEADVYPQVQIAMSEVMFPISAGNIVGQTGDFGFTTDTSGTPANTLKVSGLPAGATLNTVLSKFTNDNSGDAPEGSGELYIDVDETTQAGIYPITVQLGSDANFQTKVNLYVQEFAIVPNDIEIALGDYYHDPIELIGRFVAKPGSYDVTLPAYGNSQDQMFKGLKLTATKFVVGSDHGGSSVITMSGECQDWLDGHNDRTTTIAAAGLEFPFYAHRIGPATIVSVYLESGSINAVQGDRIKIPVGGKGWLVQIGNAVYSNWRWRDAPWKADVGGGGDSGGFSDPYNWDHDPIAYVFDNKTADWIPLRDVDKGIITLVKNDLDSYTNGDGSEIYHSTGKPQSAGLSWLQSDVTLQTLNGELLLDIADNAPAGMYTMMFTFGGKKHGYNRVKSNPFMVIVGEKQ